MLATLVLASLLCPRETLINKGWLFLRADQAHPTDHWEPVNLPHTPRQEDDTQTRFESWQGICYYGKHLPYNPAWAGKHVELRFDGAMQVADVWVNGEHRLTHTGGYLPFSVDLTKDARLHRPIEIEVRLDNRDNPSFNPGRKQSQLDFTYAGGLYRDVWLEVTPEQRLQDVYVKPILVDNTLAKIEVSNLQIASRGVQTEIEIRDAKGRLLNSAHWGKRPRALTVRNPHLWSIDSPYLYTVTTRLRSLKTHAVLDTVHTRVGIRKLDFDHKKGLFLNGKPLKLEGANRHMAFPVIGNAASDDAQYREAKRLKSLGLNIIRCAHYPPSPAFLDACDELGLLVIDPVPGWQFAQNTPAFKAHVLDDIRQMVIRDRNHPSVAIFETCLNETYNMPDEFWLQCGKVAHYAFGDGNFFTGGDSYGKRDYSRPIWDVPWTGWDDASFTRPALFKNQMGVDREYGDYEFGGEESTSRVARGDGEGAQMLQAWNFIWSHNRNRGNPWSFGDLTWEAIDTHRGMNPTSPVSKSGMLDLYRLPKTVAWFYQSQVSRTPMVHIANQWTPRPSPTKVVVFSNCDEVALLLNGKEIARQQPDHGPTTGYIGPKVADPMYWAHGKGEIVAASQVEKSIGGEPGALPFTGGNCRNLAHPPFTFEGVPYASRKLVAQGYQQGRVVAEDTIRTPGKPTRLRIVVDTQGRPLKADGADFVFVYAEIVDEHGHVMPSESRMVQLQASGSGHILSAKERHAEAGIAPYMIQSTTRAGKVTVTAKAEGLPSASVVIRTRR